MAATATEQPVLDRLSVLAGGGEHGVAWTAGQRGDKAVARAEQLRKVRPAGGKETMRAGLALKEGENRFNIRSTADFLHRFGAEKGDISTMTSAEKASYQAAQKILQKNASVALFLELKTLPVADQNTMMADKDVRKAIGEKPTTTLTFAEVRNKALDWIIKDPSFKGSFPEIDAHQPVLSDDQKRDFVEKTLMPAEDGRFASRLGTRMQEAYKEAVGFTAVSSDEARARMETDQRYQDLTFKEKTNQIASLLASRGILVGGTTPITQADVENWIQTGAISADTAADVIAAKALLTTPGIFLDVKNYRVTLPAEQKLLTANLQAKLGAANIGTPPPVPLYTDVASYIAKNTTDGEVIKHVANESRIGGLKGIYDDAASAAAAHKYLTDFDSKLLDVYKDGSFAALAGDAKKAFDANSEIGRRISALPPRNADIEKSRDLRTLQEEDLCGVLSGILGQSIGDVLEERYDIMEERMGRLTTEDQKKADQDIQKLVLELKKKMNENWIGFDPTTHERTVQKDRIKNDVTHLGFTYDKDMALKQIIARDLFVGKTGVSLTNVNFDKLNIIDGTNGANPPVQLLTPEQLKQVNEVFKLAGGEYRDKLFADLLAARTIGDRTWNMGFGLEIGGGQLSFKRGEWEQMLKLYEPEITKGLESNNEAKAALRGLEAQGVKLDHKMKWIWYVLAVLLGGWVGGGIGPGVAGIAKGAATGIGAKIAAGNIIGAAGEVGGAIAGGIGANKLVGHFSEN